MFKFRSLVAAALVALLTPVASIAIERAVVVAGTGPCSVDSDCDDQSDCTADRCTDGSCRYLISPVGAVCKDDGNDCTYDRCDDQGNCTHPNWSSGTACGLPVQDACDEPDMCDGLGTCVLNFAPAGTTCGEPQQACFTELCDGAGICDFQILDGPCDDADACTVLDTCENGECIGVPVDCTGAGDVCNDAFCLNAGAEGNCDDLVPRAAETPCDDGVFCNGLSLCDGLGTCAEGKPPCVKEEFCVEATSECLPGVDCNGNGVPDQCDLTCGSPGESCGLFPGCGQSVDCNGNGVPDECDIAGCPRIPACDDCNQNGIPDECDIASGFSTDTNPVDGIPDECVTSAPGQHAWTDDIWNLAGGYPDNNQNVASLYVTLDAAQVFLDETVEIEGLRIRSGAVLEVTQIGTGDLMIDPIDLGGITNNGMIVIGNDRVIDVRSGPFTIGEGGTFVGDPAADPTVSASMTAQSLRLLPTLCGADEQVTFRGEMTGTLFGDLELDGTGVSPCSCMPQLCPPGSGDTVRPQGGRTLPIFKYFSTAAVAARGDGRASGGFPGGPALVVHGSFRVLFGAVVEVRPDPKGSGEPVIMQLAGDFDNQSAYPSLFDWVEGELILTSSPLPIQFEVGGIDLGSTFEGFDTDVDALADRNLHSNFAMGTVMIVPGGEVTFVNAFANTVSSGPCVEALYVRDLEFGANSRITLDNCRIYHERLVDFGAQIETLGCGALVQLATGDFNGDQSVDLVDMPDLAGCLSAPGQAMIDPKCVVFDFDVDGDVDLKDVGRFMALFDGS
ncbi:MAG: hypothetical protein IH989_05025 [Planctomycetes bacterium]|nr:hypothetical protein [Planctomycetota bacterium]